MKGLIGFNFIALGLNIMINYLYGGSIKEVCITQLIVILLSIGSGLLAI